MMCVAVHLFAICDNLKGKVVINIMFDENLVKRDVSENPPIAAGHIFPTNVVLQISDDG